MTGDYGHTAPMSEAYALLLAEGDHDSSGGGVLGILLILLIAWFLTSR